MPRKPTRKPKTAAPPPPPPPPIVKRRGGNPAHEPTQADRDTVSVMVAGGIAQVDIARARGISDRTLRTHYKKELATASAALNTIVIIQHMKRIRAGDFAAIKWWEQSRMSWSEHIVVDPGKGFDQPMRVIVELVGDAAPARADPSAPRSGSRLPDDIRTNVKLVG